MRKILIIGCSLLVIIICGFYIFRPSPKTLVLEPKNNNLTQPAAVIAPKLIVTPARVLQGEPVMITVEELNASTTIKTLYFASKPVRFFIYNSKPTAFVAVDLSKKVGEYPVTAELSDGTILKSSVAVIARVKVQAPLGIPDKLGGNSTTSQNNLVNNLAQENAMIKNLPSTSTALWSQPFRYPILDPVVTDSYGYTRLTGAYTISHLGTDFKAEDGTPVMAMNSGVIVYAGTTTEYGKMIVVDHGLGLQTLYLHLSKINFTKGTVVARGEVIGESGQTGYAEQPHLHISIKINSISIDPIKFLNFFK